MSKKNVSSRNISKKASAKKKMSTKTSGRRNKKNTRGNTSPLSTKYKLLLICLFIGLFLIRLQGLNQMLADDEQVNVIAAASHPYGSEFHQLPHPPIPVLLYSLGGYIWGPIGIRIVCLLLGAGTILLTFFMAKRLFDEQTAYYAAGIILVLFWHTLESIQISVENTFTFVMTATLFVYLVSMHKQNAKWYLFSGIMLGLLFITKFTAVLVAGSMGLHMIYHMWKNWKNKTIIKEQLISHTIIFGIALIFLVSYFGLSFAFAGGAENNLHHASNYIGDFFNQDIVNVLSILIQAIFFISPLLFILFIYSLVCPKDPANNPCADNACVLFYTLIFVFVIFYLFFVTISFRAFERFWSPLIPSMAIIGGSTLASLKLKKEHFLTLVFTSAVAYTILCMINIPIGTLHPLFPKSAYFSHVLSFNWDFYVPFHSSTGPFGFLVKFSVLMIGFVVSAILLLASLIIKKIKPSYASAGKFLFILALAVGIGYNALLIQEYLWSPTSPNVNGVSWEVHNYVNAQFSPNVPLATYQFLGKYHWRERDLIHFGHDDSTSRSLSDSERVVAIVNYPAINQETLFWKELQKCVLLKTFTDKQTELGWVYDCRTQINS